MSKAKPSAVSLGQLQAEAESATRNLRAAQTAFTRAADRLTSAQEAHTTAVVALNQGASAVRAASHVTTLWAK